MRVNKECKICREIIDDAETYCQDCIDVLRLDFSERLENELHYLRRKISENNGNSYITYGMLLVVRRIEEKFADVLSEAKKE